MRYSLGTWRKGCKTSPSRVFSSSHAGLNPHGPEVAVKHDPSIGKRTELARWPRIEFLAQRGQGAFELPLIERGALGRPNGKGLGKEALFDPHVLDLDRF